MKQLFKMLKLGLLISCSIFAIFPFYWMISTALSKHSWIELPWLISWPPYLGALRVVIIDNPFFRWMLNTLFLSITGTVGNLLIASLAAFAFGCLRFKYRDLIFYILLSSMIFPEFLMVIPRFFLMDKFKGINTYWAIFIPRWFSMFAVFLLRQYFVSIPQEFLNAARMDGANLWQMYLKIIMPLGKPVLAALFVISFLDRWNSFLWPVVVLQTPNMQTLTVGIAQFYTLYQVGYNKIMAGSIISLIPVLLLFAIFQKYIAQGLRMQTKF